MQFVIVPQEEVADILKYCLPSHREELPNYGDFYVFLSYQGSPEKLVQVEVFKEVLEEIKKYPGETFNTNIFPFEELIECVGEKVGVPFVIFGDASKNRLIYIGLKTYLNGLKKEVDAIPEGLDD